MDSREVVTAKLVAFVGENLLPDDRDFVLDDTTQLLERGVLDSLKTAILLNFIHNELKTRIPPEKLSTRNFKDVRSIADMVCGLESTATS